MTEIHDQINSLLAAYVMDAVPAEEIPAIRAHILSCEMCFAEADAYATSLAALAESVAPVPLPEGFSERVLIAAGGAVTERPPARRLALPKWFRGALVGSTAALAALMLIVTSVSLARSMERERQFESAVAALVRDDSALTLEGPGGAVAVVASNEGGATLVALNLGEAPEGSDYQLWLMKDGVATPSDTFDASGSIVIVDSIDALTGYDGAAITVEPEGGSSQPTTEPVLST